MDRIEQLRLKAEASRQFDFALPVVDTVEDARAIAAQVAAQVAALPDDQRLLALSHLNDLRETLDGRLGLLEREMAENRRQLRLVNQGLEACKRYGAGEALSRRRPRRG